MISNTCRSTTPFPQVDRVVEPRGNARAGVAPTRPCTRNRRATLIFHRRPIARRRCSSLAALTLLIVAQTSTPTSVRAHHTAIFG